MAHAVVAVADLIVTATVTDPAAVAAAEAEIRRAAGFRPKIIVIVRDNRASRAGKTLHSFLYSCRAVWRAGSRTGPEPRQRTYTRAIQGDSMATSKSTFQKRQKEMKRQEKQRMKAERRAQKKLAGPSEEEPLMEPLTGPLLDPELLFAEPDPEN
ncbi:MAG TPA: hypothetical protein VNI36_13270 [Candidatus Dormibacteraeota bacterium]|nr:hypothetical protein [Candidatus Dormibacteraeota bacterium]